MSDSQRSKTRFSLGLEAGASLDEKTAYGGVMLVGDLAQQNTDALRRLAGSGGFQLIDEHGDRCPQPARRHSTHYVDPRVVWLTVEPPVGKEEDGDGSFRIQRNDKVGQVRDACDLEEVGRYENGVLDLDAGGQLGRHEAVRKGGKVCEREGNGWEDG